MAKSELAIIKANQNQQLYSDLMKNPIVELAALYGLQKLVEKYDSIEPFPGESFPKTFTIPRWLIGIFPPLGIIPQGAQGDIFSGIGKPDMVFMVGAAAIIAQQLAPAIPGITQGITTGLGAAIPALLSK